MVFFKDCRLLKYVKITITVLTICFNESIIFFQKRMILKSTIILFLCLHIMWIGSSYTTITNPSHYLIEVDRVTLNTIPSAIYNYTITYKHAFSEDAIMIVSFAKLIFCPSSTIQRIRLIASQTNTKINNEIKVEFQGNSDIVSFSINYFAYDGINTNYIDSYVIQILVNQTETSKGLVKGISKLNVSDSDSYITCFPYHLNGYKIQVFPYIVNVRCYKSGDGRVIVDVQNSQTVNHSEARNGPNNVLIYYKRVQVGVIIIKADSSMDKQISTITTLASSASNSLTVNPNTQNNFLFIGLRSFSMQTRCWNMGLSDDNKMVQSGSFNKLQFNFIKIVKNSTNVNNAQLNHIQVQFFSSEIILAYKNIYNLTEITLFQFNINSTSVINLTKLQTTGTHGIIHVVADLLGPIDNQKFKLVFNYTSAARMFARTTQFKLIVINEIILKSVQNQVQMRFTNIPTATKSHFTFPSGLMWNNGFQSGNDYIAEFSFDKKILGIQRWIMYQDAISGDLTYLSFYLPSITKIKTSTVSKVLQTTIELMPGSVPATISEFSENSNYIQNLQITAGGAIIASVDYIKSAGADNSDLIFDYKWNPVFEFCLKFSVKLATLRSVRSMQDSNTFEFIFINFKDASSISLSQFNIFEPRAIAKSVRCQDDKVILRVQCDQSLGNNTYDMEVQFSWGLKVFVQEIRTIKRFSKFSSIKYKNNLDIYLKNPQNLTSSTLPNITFNNPYITIQSIQILSDDSIKISTTYNNTIDLFKLEVQFHFNNDTVFTQIASISLVYDFPLIHCAQNAIFLCDIYQKFAIALQYLYLAFFVCAFICGNKLLALQTIFLIQIAYYSMMPIGLECPYFGFTGMRYISGFNPFGKSLPQTEIPSNYKYMGFSSNFLSNVNLMLMFIPFCPLVFLILTFAGNKSKSYKTNPRLKRYGKMFILQLPLTLLLFSSFNIYSSTVIDVQYLGKNNVSSMVVAIFVALIIPGYAVIYFLFKSHFHQFIQKFDEIQRIGSFSKQISFLIRNVYPLVLMLQFLIIPLFLAIQKLSNCSVYISLIIQILSLIYVIVATPYVHQPDNVRLIIHKGISLGICSTLVAQKIMTTKTVRSQQILMWIPLVLLIFLVLGLLVNGFQVIRLSIRWFRKRGVINHAMKMKQEATKIKPVSPVQQYNHQKWYPKLQFGRYNRKNRRPQAQHQQVANNHQFQNNKYKQINAYQYQNDQQLLHINTNYA